MSQLFDADRVQLSADAQSVAERIAISGAFASFGAAGDALAYRTSGPANITNEQLTWYSRSGAVIGKVGETLTIAGGATSVALAPDSKRAALMITSPELAPDLWVVEFARGLVSRLTFSDDGEIAPVWAPDSRRLAYRTGVAASPSFSVMVKDVDGTSDAASPVEKPVPGIPTGWSSEGRFLLFTRTSDAGTIDLFALSLERQTVTALLETPFTEQGARLSPDNRWMVYQSNESGQAEIYVRPFLVSGDGTPSVGPKSRVSSSGGVLPRWRSDGREIVYRSLTGDFMAVDVKASGDTIDISLPHRLFPSVAGVHAWDVTADAQRLLLSVPVDTAAIAEDPMTVILNWKTAFVP
jgi:Tol biopolymer transport system component